MRSTHQRRNRLVGITFAITAGLLSPLAIEAPATLAQPIAVTERPDLRPLDMDGGEDADQDKWTKRPRPNGNGWTVCPPEARRC